jgi:E3 SUMO-protein ligase PIAS1
MTVHSLKGVITGLVDESCANMGKAGRKSDLQERIVRALRGLQADGRVDKWVKARAVILQVSSGLE